VATAKSVNLRVRPFTSVDLSFPVDGVISWQPDSWLGQSVEGIDVEALYAVLGETVAGDDSRLLFDSERISAYLIGVPFSAAGQEAGIPGPFDQQVTQAVREVREAARELWDRERGIRRSLGTGLLSRLRNTSEAADLDRALMMRQNAYLTSYSPEVLSEVRRVYHHDPDDSWAVRHRLMKKIEYDAGTIHQILESEYQQKGWFGTVITDATSTSKNEVTQDSGSDRIHFTGSTDTNSPVSEFRYPVGENDLRYHQTRAAVRQEFLNAWRMSEMCRHGETTFANELGAIDSSIRRLQAAYIDTFLFAPFDGVVTGIFHGEGDYVRAGEPVLRVENPRNVYLVGTVKYRGMLRIGTKLEVSTTLFEEAGAAPITVSGEVVAVRGHDSVSEQWDLLILCQNFDDLHPDDLILPLNYNFDFESTTVTVTGP
jgi:HlyD family secretion protein